MNGVLVLIEQGARWLGALIGLGTLSIAVVSMLRSLRRPAGREEPGARLALRAPILIAATLAFVALAVWLWRPLPCTLPVAWHTLLLILGCVLLVGGCLLYLWGLRTLGTMFAPSSGFGVRLHAGHRLIVSGPYAIVRHPMYLAVVLAAWGSLTLYQTWASLGFAVMMLGLVVRGRREERVLEDEFGERWREYAGRVPGWLPSRRRNRPAESRGR
jgi:protein-S-isoprenylcysteine O-methyltransferase Ste14